MSINSDQHSQFELFPDSRRRRSANSSNKPYFFDGLTLSLENAVVTLILIIVSFVIFFSIGVEKGKKVAQGQFIENQALQEKKAVQKEENSVLSVSPEVEQKDEKKALDTTGRVSIASIGPRVLSEKEQIFKLSQEIQKSSESIYTIQVASFKKDLNAQIEAKNLDGIGKDVFVMRKGNYSIVCIGKFVISTNIQIKSGNTKCCLAYPHICQKP